MLYEVAIRLTSQLLGEVRHPEVRRFLRTKDQDIRIHSAHWAWAWSEAAAALHCDVDTTLIRAVEGIRCPRIELYTRRFTDRKGQRASEMFEAVRDNTVLTFELAVLKPAVPGINVPTAEQLKTMLEFIGKFIGISQWGNNFGFGRFIVNHVKLR